MKIILDKYWKFLFYAMRQPMELKKNGIYKKILQVLYFVLYVIQVAFSFIVRVALFFYCIYFFDGDVEIIFILFFYIHIYMYVIHIYFYIYIFTYIYIYIYAMWFFFLTFYLCTSNIFWYFICYLESQFRFCKRYKTY